VGFFGGALGIQRDQAFEDLFVGEGGGPAVGGEDGGVEVVVNLFEDADEAGVVDFLVFVVEGFAGAEFFEDVVHVGQREPGGELLLTFAMGYRKLRATYGP